MYNVFAVLIFQKAAKLIVLINLRQHIISYLLYRDRIMVYFLCPLYLGKQYFSSAVYLCAE